MGKFQIEIPKLNLELYKDACEILYQRLKKAIEGTRFKILDDDRDNYTGDLYYIIEDNEDPEESIYTPIHNLGYCELVFGGYEGKMFMRQQAFGLQTEYYTLFTIFGFQGPYERIRSLYQTIGITINLEVIPFNGKRNYQFTVYWRI